MECFEGEQLDLIANAMLHRQPVQFHQHRCNVIILLCPCYYSCGCVLHTLKFRPGGHWEAKEQTVAVVEARHYMRLDKRTCRALGDEVPDDPDVMDLKVGSAADV